MQAVTFSEFGGPDVLTLSDLPQPAAGPGEVLVRVAASTVNPTDLLMRNGAQAGLMTELSPPYLCGMEFSGTIVLSGDEAGIAPGTPVIGVVNPRRPGGGAYAQFLVVPAASVAPLAETTDLTAAAAVPMNALTAIMALDTVGLSAGDTLLVTGGTGILGGLVLQIARQRGIRTLTAGRPEEHDLLWSLGAGTILPRDANLVAAVRGVLPDGADALIDTALIGQQVSQAVRDGGSAVSLRRSHPIEDARLNVGYVAVTNGMMDNAILRQIAAYLDSGVITARVADGGVFSYQDAVAAHRMAETGGFRGRVVVTFAD